MMFLFGTNTHNVNTLAVTQNEKTCLLLCDAEPVTRGGAAKLMGDVRGKLLTQAVENPLTDIINIEG